MKKTITMLALALGLGACTSETSLGPCIGAFDDGDPKFVYETSTKNVVLAVLFSETIVVPLVVIAKETKCPVSKRE